MTVFSASRPAYKPVSELSRRGLLREDDSLWSGERPTAQGENTWLWIALAVGLLGFRLLIPAPDELPADYAARLAERFPTARLVAVHWTGTVDQPAFRCQLQDPSGSLHNVKIWGDGTIQPVSDDRPLAAALEAVPAPEMSDAPGFRTTP